MTVFEYVVTSPLDQLKHGAREHAVLATEHRQVFSRCLLRDDWTCHRCKTRLPGFMELDHVKSHDIHQEQNLRTICQFCHNLRHPLWAALRGRIRAFWSPATGQDSINRIAWSVLSAERCGHKMPDVQAAMHGFLEAIRHRELLLSDIIGSTHSEALFEAMLVSSRYMSSECSRHVARGLDQYIRFWPLAAERILEQPSRSSSTFSSWQGNRFVDMTGVLLENLPSKVEDPGLLREVYRLAMKRSGTGEIPAVEQ